MSRVVSSATERTLRYTMTSRRAAGELLDAIGTDGLVDVKVAYDVPTDGVADAQPALQQAVDDLAAAGNGGTILLGAGHYLLKAPLKLPRTPSSYFTRFNGAVRLLGVGADAVLLRGDFDSSVGRGVIEWKYHTMTVSAWENSGGKAVAVIQDADGQYIGVDSYLEIDGASSYSGYLRITAKDSSEQPTYRFTTDATFIAGTENETATVRVMVRAVDQMIAGMHIQAPLKTGTCCIYYQIVFPGAWDSTSTYTWEAIGNQRISGIFRDLVLRVDAYYHDACMDFEGTVRDSWFENIQVRGGISNSDWRYDPYMIKTFAKIDPGKGSFWPFGDGSGLQQSTVQNCSGGTFPAFSGRMNQVQWANGFYAGGNKGPCWDIQNSYRVRIMNVSGEGHAEKPAELRIRGSAMVRIEHWSGGGNEAYLGDSTIGHAVSFENCQDCRIVDRGTHWQSPEATEKINQNKYMLVIDSACRNVKAERFNLNYSGLATDLVSIAGTDNSASGFKYSGSGGGGAGTNYSV